MGSKQQSNEVSGCLVPIVFIVVIALLFLMLKISEASRPELGKAAAAGDLTKVQQLLDQGADVNGHNIFGDTVLENAICDGNSNPGSEDIALLLVEKGAKITGDTQDCAVLYKRMRMIDVIVDKKQTLRENDLALYLYVEHAKPDYPFVQFLLDHGVNIDAQYKGGGGDDKPYSALGLAVHYRNRELVEYLIGHHADVNAPACGSISALVLANEAYRVGDTTGPGVHYYYDVPADAALANYLRSQGAH